MSNKYPAIFILGPTASGKTDLALRLLEALPCEIISVDSVMIYKGMDIGTAKPEAKVLQQAPHRLIDICDPSESYSAAQFREDALRHMEEIRSNDKIPLLVGGTFLYFRSLQYGLSPLPGADPEVRAKLEAEAKKNGWSSLHARLKQIDPQTAGRIHPNDPQRIQRALEVYEVSGKTMTEYFMHQHDAELPYQVHKFILNTPQRQLLHNKINDRFDQMMELGLLEEVRVLHDRGDLHMDLPSMRAVGYRQAWEHLQGDYGETTMIERAKAATRQYAKRQITWLRSEQDGTWFDANSPHIHNEVLKKLQSTLNF